MISKFLCRMLSKHKMKVIWMPCNKVGLILIITFKKDKEIRTMVLINCKRAFTSTNNLFINKTVQSRLRKNQKLINLSISMWHKATSTCHFCFRHNSFHHSISEKNNMKWSVYLQKWLTFIATMRNSTSSFHFFFNSFIIL